MKTIRIPLMGVWERQEYLGALHAKLVYEAGHDLPAIKEIKCSFCLKPVREFQINVVEYGEKVACQKCFKIRYKSHRQQYREYPIPSDLDSRLDSIPQLSDEERAKAEAKKKAAVDKAVEIQDNNIRQLRDAAQTPKD